MNQEKKSWTTGRLLKWAESDFRRRGIETARLDAELLLARALGTTRVELYTRFEDLPSQARLELFREMVKRRRGREPVAHILGRKSFHDIELEVPKGLFVPRPESEILVDEAVSLLRAARIARPRVLDLCTGTGAVALAVLKAVEEASAWAVDLEPSAGEAVRKNAAALGLSRRIEFRQGDLFEGVADLEPFHLITANPPYVESGALETLMPEIKEHEPRRALDGGPEGMDVIIRIIQGAPSMLRPSGFLLIEVGEGQAERAAAMAGGGLSFQKAAPDLSGVHRVVVFGKS